MNNDNVEGSLGYLYSAEFLELRDYYDELSIKLMEYYKTIDVAPNVIEKSFRLKNLIVILGAFDDHLRLMIKRFPDYYNSSPASIDLIFKENDNFIAAAVAEIKHHSYNVN